MLRPLPSFQVRKGQSRFLRDTGQLGQNSLRHFTHNLLPLKFNPESTEPGQVPGAHSDPCGPRSPALPPEKQSFMVNQCVSLEQSRHYSKGQHCSGGQHSLPRASQVSRLPPAAKVRAGSLEAVKTPWHWLLLLSSTLQAVLATRRAKV